MSNAFDFMLDPNQPVQPATAPTDPSLYDPTQTQNQRPAIAPRPGGVRPANLGKPLNLAKRPPVTINATPDNTEGAAGANMPPRPAIVGPAPAPGAGGRPPLIGGKFGAYLGDAMAGVAGTPAMVDPITGFAYGFSGARNAEAARIKAAADAAQTAEDRTYSRGQDTLKNARDDRALDINQGKADTAAAKAKLVGDDGKLNDNGEVQVFKLVGAYRSAQYKAVQDQMTADPSLGVGGNAQALYDEAEKKSTAYAARLRESLTSGVDPEVADMKAQEAADAAASAADKGGAKPPPAVGDVVRGYRFKGGDPASEASWEAVQ